MALSTKADANEIITELGLSEEEFSWDSDHGGVGNVTVRVNLAIAKAAALTQKRVGGSYTATGDADAQNIKSAEHALACHYMLRERLVRLTSRPEEAPPPEYIDLDSLQREIETRREEWEELTALYADNDLAKAGTAFSFGGKGVDETEEDDYDDRDYGSIP
jgi:hypothetical protein